MMADDYGDDLDALTSLLDEDENPYDDGEPLCVKSEEAQRVSQQVKKHQYQLPSQGRSNGSGQSSSGASLNNSLDEEKSKLELIEELQRMREQMSQMQGGSLDASQISSQTKTKTSLPKEAFSSALFPDPKPKTTQKKKAEPKPEAHQDKLTKMDDLDDDEDDDGGCDDGLSDLFDDEGDNDKGSGTVVTPQKAASLFKKTKTRQAHTPKTNAAPPAKKVSPYKCGLCDKTFEDRQAMNVHEFKHKVVKSCTCDVCGKSFTDKLQLQTHLRTHKTSPPDVSRQQKRQSSSGGSLDNDRQSGTPNRTRERNTGSERGRTDGHSTDIGSKSVPQIGSGAKRKPAAEEGVCETDYYSKIRIVNPLVPSAVMKERMRERKMIRMSILRHYSRTGDMEGDWVTMGVIVKKFTKSDNKGKPFTIWVMNDLSDLEEKVSLYLFGKVHEEHWKTAEGSVIGVLNACLMDKREDSNFKESENVKIKVDHPQKLLLLGRSKDFGTCRGTKKNGQGCSNFVNINDCQYCAYHVQAEFKKMGSKRTDLSSSYSGITPKSYMKKLQKDNFIYGGRSVGMPSMTLAGGGVKSQSKMTNQFNTNKLNLKSMGVRGVDAIVEEAKSSVLTLHGKGQAEKDMMVKVEGASKEFSDLLKAPTPGSQNLMRHMVTVETAKKNVSTISAKSLLKQHKHEMASKRSARSCHSPSPASGSPSNSSSRQKLLTESTKQNTTAPPQDDFTPKLGRGWSGGGDIDLDVSPPKFGSKSKMSTTGKGSTALAKQKALALIRQKGPIRKEDPNAVKKAMDDRRKESVKRRAEENWKKDIVHDDDPDSPALSRPTKKRKTFLGQDLEMSKDEMDKIMKAKSCHAGLLAEHEAELMDRYFKEMEKKEGLENRLDSVREMKRKVVSCKECAFTWFAATDKCKKENHSLRWHEAMQRFFKCKECKSRTVAFDRLPNKTCRSCGNFNWERATMLKERDGPKLGGETLKLRGDEEKWL